ncbi:hypothetical protein GCM10020256_49760 [Streptomyces thermocoprophilus]
MVWGQGAPATRPDPTRTARPYETAFPGGPVRTLISTAFVSLDGVVEAPGGEPGYRNSG